MATVANGRVSPACVSNDLLGYSVLISGTYLISEARELIQIIVRSALFIPTFDILTKLHIVIA